MLYEMTGLSFTIPGETLCERPTELPFIDPHAGCCGGLGIHLLIDSASSKHCSLPSMASQHKDVPAQTLLVAVHGLPA